MYNRYNEHLSPLLDSARVLQSVEDPLSMVLINGDTFSSALQNTQIDFRVLEESPRDQTVSLSWHLGEPKRSHCDDSRPSSPRIFLLCSCVLLADYRCPGATREYGNPASSSKPSSYQPSPSNLHWGIHTFNPAPSAATT